MYLKNERKRKKIGVAYEYLLHQCYFSFLYFVEQIWRSIKYCYGKHTVIKYQINKNLILYSKDIVVLCPYIVICDLTTIQYYVRIHYQNSKLFNSRPHKERYPLGFTDLILLIKGTKFHYVLLISIEDAEDQGRKGMVSL